MAALHYVYILDSLCVCVYMYVCAQYTQSRVKELHCHGVVKVTHLSLCICICIYNAGCKLSLIYMVLMRDERKKQARSNKQTRQSNTAHPRQSLLREKMSCLGHVHPFSVYYYCRSPGIYIMCTCALAVVCCLTLLASFFLPSHLSLKTSFSALMYR